MTGNTIGREMLKTQSRWSRKKKWLYGFIAWMGTGALMMAVVTISTTPEDRARWAAENAQQVQASAQKAAQADNEQKRKKEKVRAALLSVKRLLISNAPSYMLSYSAAKQCVEIARAASSDAGRNDEDDMRLGFIRVQMQCDEWASLSWNAGRP